VLHSYGSWHSSAPSWQIKTLHLREFKWTIADIEFKYIKSLAPTSIFICRPYGRHFRGIPWGWRKYDLRIVRTDILAYAVSQPTTSQYEVFLLVTCLYLLPWGWRQYYLRIISNNLPDWHNPSNENTKYVITHLLTYSILRVEAVRPVNSWRRPTRLHRVTNQKIIIWSMLQAAID
jgi:hypothetical protein